MLKGSRGSSRAAQVRMTRVLWFSYVQADMDPIVRSLHEKMRDLSIKRQNGTALRRRMKWALYEEKHFKRLIEDIIDLVNDLVQLFPAVRQEQKKLCKLEVSEIGISAGLPVLKDIAASQDKDLETAISEAMKSNVSILILYGASLRWLTPCFRAMGPLHSTTRIVRLGSR
jgi:hypothetical protein